jgi:superfamily II DNA or RNA helicase
LSLAFPLPGFFLRCPFALIPLAFFVVRSSVRRFLRTGSGDTVKDPHANLRIGDSVGVRRQRWRITDIRPGDGCSVLTLAGSGTLNAGVTRRVITPFDVVEPSNRLPRLRIVTMRRWRAACRALLTTHCSASSLRTAARARIDLHPYQLEPALAILSGLGSRVLIADEVGLGKTIQAALVVSELVARGAADRILVLSPAGLREQWAHELRERFSIDAAIVGMREGRRRAALLPVGLNPWSTVPVAIGSIDYVKRPEVLATIRACRWDVVVIDEAHGVASESDRHEAAAALCGRAAYVVLLTATPHNGDERAFRSLCDMGSHGQDQLLIFRRNRREVPVGAGRRVHRVHVRPGDSERRMHAALADLARAAGAERDGIDLERRLILTTLYKRALSSAHSLEQSASRRLALRRAPSDGLHQLLLPLDDETGELDLSDDVPTSSAPLMEDRAKEERLLLMLIESARAAIPDQAKLRALRRLLARLDRRGERAIVFTEYRDTLLHVRDSLHRPSVVIHGGMTIDDRRAAIEAFVNGRATLLLATDAAGEGLNLHHACRVVINLELPWNPMRLEQRIGRVDRIGQRRRVHVFHLIARDTVETHILERLKARLARADADIGAADPLGLLDVDPDRPAEVSATRLIREASVEHERLRTIRSLRRPDSAGRLRTTPDPVDDVLVAFSRRRQLRLRFSSRALAVLNTSLEDRVGRPVAVHLTPIVLAPPSRVARGPGRRLALAHILDALSHLAVESIDPMLLSWRRESSRTHHAFCETRLARERAIAHALDEVDDRFFQVGLFDRRADHHHLADAGERRRLKSDAAEEIAAAERAGAIHAQPALTALFLVVG